MIKVWHLACVIAAIKLMVMLTASYGNSLGQFDDDAFYYFGIARHLALGDGSTFNGIDPTNGYHPLWQLLLVPVFWVAEGKLALVLVTLLSSALFVLSALQIDRLGRLTERPDLLFVSAVPLLVLGAAGPSFWFSGMETGLLLLLLLSIAAFFVQNSGLTAPEFSVADAAKLGTLMALTALARLDAVILLSVLGVYALVVWFRGRNDWLILAFFTAVIPAIVLSAYIAINLWSFGTPMPVSGQAKALGGGFNPQVFLQFLRAPVLFGAPTMAGVAAVFVVIAGLATCQSGPIGHLARLGGMIMLGGTLAIAYYASTSSWRLWPWYFYAAPLAIALSGPAVLAHAVMALNIQKKHFGGIRNALCLVILMAPVIAGVRLWYGMSARTAYVVAGPQLAAAIDPLLPAGEPLAMGDRAGSVGYHLKRPLVHLEGLVNSREFLSAMSDGKVMKFLSDRNVSVYARGDSDTGLAAPALPGCMRMQEPQQGGGEKFYVVVCEQDLLINMPLKDGTFYRVWRYRPELNS